MHKEFGINNGSAVNEKILMVTNERRELGSLSFGI